MNQNHRSRATSFLFPHCSCVIFCKATATFFPDHPQWTHWMTFTYHPKRLKCTWKKISSWHQKRICIVCSVCSIRWPLQYFGDWIFSPRDSWWPVVSHLSRIHSVRKTDIWFAHLPMLFLLVESYESLKNHLKMQFVFVPQLLMNNRRKKSSKFNNERLVADCV